MRDTFSTARFGKVVLNSAAMLLAGVAVQFCPCFVSPGHAQMSLWDQVFGPSYSRDDNAARQRKPEPLNDLRPSATPWRSDVMLNAINAAIGHYEKIVASGGWPVVPVGRMMRPGDEDPRVPILRKRLRISGDLPANGSYFDSETYDSELEAAVKRFQLRTGIRPSGAITRSVYPTLNITAEQRLAQLRLNYDRIRALMTNVEDRYILVNIPAFQLEAVNKYEVQLRYRVIVGRPERQTPEVHATIRALNFFPYWRVPKSIATLDLIPRLQKEPDYLAKEGIRVYDANNKELDPKTIDWFSPETATYRFKQDPGEKNALGLLRLDMTNQFGVYMHDTPMKDLFDQRSRAFSAGCVRVQNVFDLGDWVAQNEPGWEQPGGVQRTLAEGKPFDLNLTRPVPVYFAYITAWAEPSNGHVEFRPDIYGRDGAAIQTAYRQDAEDGPPTVSAAALAP